MGSGKSFLYQELKKELESQKTMCLDFDEELVKRSKFSSISKWVEKEGWEGFRGAEYHLFKELLASSQKGLYGLGGGSLNQQTLKLLKQSQSAFLVWMDTDFETCWSRIHDDRTRPLVQKGKEYCHKLFNERLELYRQADFHWSQLSDKQKQELKEKFKIS